MLERAAELSMLVDCLEAVEHSSRGQVLLVGGEAGVGKTTLVRRFCEQRGQSVRILWGACDPLATFTAPSASRVTSSTMYRAGPDGSRCGASS